MEVQEHQKHHDAKHDSYQVSFRNKSFCELSINNIINFLFTLPLSRAPLILPPRSESAHPPTSLRVRSSSHLATSPLILPPRSESVTARPPTSLRVHSSSHLTPSPLILPPHSESGTGHANPSSGPTQPRARLLAPSWALLILPLSPMTVITSKM